MKPIYLSQVCNALDAKLVGADVAFTSVSTDTRTLTAGALFVALQGPNYDGQQFVKTAQEKGAVAALVQTASTEAIPTLIVKDTRKALGQLAAWYRSQFTMPIVAITGNSGKTTVKEMTAAVLKQAYNTLITQGNLNNEIGVPLTLFNLTGEHQAAVIELGANHLGEIAETVAMVKPRISIITNVTGAHLEGFGSVENIAKAKGEIITGLPADGVAVLNRDDRFYDFWLQLAGERRVISYGMHPAADITAIDIKPTMNGSEFIIRTPKQTLPITLPLLGQHNVLNALAVAAVVEILELNGQVLQAGLGFMQPVPGRLVMKTGINKVRVLDDTYNANPGSVKAAIDVLASQAGRKILVLGDMAELGEEAVASHRMVGVYAKEKGINELFALGSLSQEAVVNFADANYAKHHAFTDYEALLNTLTKFTDNNTTMLVKGSRSAKMERVVNDLTQTGIV